MGAPMEDSAICLRINDIVLAPHSGIFLPEGVFGIFLGRCGAA